MKILLFFAAPVFLVAQWPAFPPARPDLSAPAPKAADGHPDLSGLWDRGVIPGAPPAPPANAVPDPNRPRAIRPFQDLPSLFPGSGLPMLPWAAELRRKRLADNSKDHPDAHCLPLHPVQLHAHPQPRKIIQTPGLVVIVYEANSGLRQIFLDGRKLPGEEAQPWWYGYSVGRWEGDTLVVESTGFRDEGWIDEEGTPMMGSGKVTERFRRPTYGTLEIQIAVDDPKTFSKPFTYTLQQRLIANQDLIEFVCAENNRSTPHLVGAK